MDEGPERKKDIEAEGDLDSSNLWRSPSIATSGGTLSLGMLDDYMKQRQEPARPAMLMVDGHSWDRMNNAGMIVNGDLRGDLTESQRAIYNELVMEGRMWWGP